MHGSKELNSISLEVANIVLFTWLLSILCDLKVLTVAGNFFFIPFLLQQEISGIILECFYFSSRTATSRISSALGLACF